MGNNASKGEEIVKQIFFSVSFLVFTLEAQASYDTARQAQQQAYSDYYNAVSQLTSPTPDALKSLRKQILEPANQDFTKSQQADYNAAHPTPPVPKGTNAKLTSEQREKNKKWHMDRFKAIGRLLQRKQKDGKNFSKSGASDLPAATTSPVDTALPKPGVEIHDKFEKEIEFHHH